MIWFCAQNCHLNCHIYFPDHEMLKYFYAFLWIHQLLLSQGPPTSKGPHEAFIIMSYSITSCIFMLFLCLLHCLDSMSEHLGRIISNAFTVSVEKLWRIQLRDKIWEGLGNHSQTKPLQKVDLLEYSVFQLANSSTMSMHDHLNQWLPG